MDRMMSLSPLCWPTQRAGDAIAELARHAGMLEDEQSAEPLAGATADRLDEPELGRWIDGHARRRGLEAEPVGVRLDETTALLSRGGPALVRLSAQPASLLAILPRRWGRVRVLAPDGRVHRISADQLRDFICVRESGGDDALADVLAAMGLSTPRQARARDVLLQHTRARDVPGASAWLLRVPVGAAVTRHGRTARIVRQMARLAGLHGLQYVLCIAAWVLLGRAAFGGGGEGGVLAAWALLLFVLAALRASIDRTAGRLSIDAGSWLKRRLLVGALRLRPDEVRYQGAGHFLGRVNESEALETLGLGGGLLAGVSTVELLLALAVQRAGAGAGLSIAVQVAAIVAVIVLSLRFRRLQSAWTRTRLTMSGNVIEKMVGRRTLVAQLPRARWHEGEDEMLHAYGVTSRAMDRLNGLLIGGVPRAYLLAGVAALMPAFVTGASGASLAIGLGGTLLGYQALLRITMAIAQLSGAAVAWSEAGPLFAAAARTPGPVAPMIHEPTVTSEQLLAAEGLVYRHEGRAEPTLRGASLTINRGDRIILQGTSGAGKSTLAAILGGSRDPQAGLLLIGGLDRHIVDADSWRQRVVIVPQFHENHVFSNTLAFNLLLGRRWPPRLEDLDEAESVCRELGLGPLLDRMPSGMQQTIGESGWQLSNGERSRLFIARALLQQPDLLVMDESLATLDPDTAGQVMECVTSRASAIVVIAHQ